MKPISPRYMQQSCPMTLREGLDEYRSLMPDLIDENRLNGPSRTLFHNHDICHIVFGCDISLRHEGMVDTWTMFGSDVGYAQYITYLRLPEVTGLFVQVGIWRGVLATFQSIPSILRVLIGVWRMKSKWPWKAHQAWLDSPLHEIRQHFGIRVVP